MPKHPIDTDALIREAYGVVAQPEKLFDLHVRLERAQDRSQAAIDKLAPHLEQIGEMFDTIHLGADADFSGLGLLPAGSQPVSSNAMRLLTLDSDMRVIDCRANEWPTGRLVAGQYVPDWLFGDHSAALSKVRQAMRTGEPEEVFYFRLYSGADDPRGFMAQAELSKTDKSALLTFSRVRLEWSENDGVQFAELMGLTGAEQQLTKFIVEGRSISEFASARGRTVGTARNQMKAVLRKLGIGSQSELVSLYAGFAGSLALRGVAAPQDDPVALGQELSLDSGPPLRFERYGKAGGKPVLMLHGAIEGPFFTPNLQHRAQSAGLEIFVPWMPFYSDRDRPSDPRKRVEWFVDRLDQFCEKLRIERCALLACSFSSAYGFAALKRWPDRFCGLAVCGFTPPFGKLEELGELNALWRAPLVLGRSAPGVVELLVRSIVRLAMRGEAYRYFDKLLKDSPVDRMTLRQPDIAAVVRKAFQNRPDKAGRAMAHAMQIQVLDWDEWIDDLKRPVRIIIGEHDVVHKPNVQKAVCKRCKFEDVGPLKDVGVFPCSNSLKGFLQRSGASMMSEPFCCIG